MSQKRAMCLILLGGLFMSFVGLYMRVLSNADGFQILFYRSLSLCLMVGFVCCLRRRILPIAFFKSIDKNDVYMGMALSLAFTCYIFAMTIPLLHRRYLSCLQHLLWPLSLDGFGSVSGRRRLLGSP